MTREEIIRRFVCTPSRVAVVGASVKEDRPVSRVMGYLAGEGFDLYPVNPSYAGQRIAGRECLASLPGLSSEVDVIALFLSAKMQGGIPAELGMLQGKPVIWFQPGAENGDLEARLVTAGYSVVSGDCIMAVRMSRCTKKGNGKGFL